MVTRAERLDDLGLALDRPDDHLGGGSGQHDEPRGGQALPDLDKEWDRFGDVLDDLGRQDEVERADVAHFVEKARPHVDTELGTSALGGTRRIDADRLPPEEVFRHVHAEAVVAADVEEAPHSTPPGAAECERDRVDPRSPLDVVVDSRIGSGVVELRADQAQRPAVGTPLDGDVPQRVAVDERNQAGVRVLAHRARRGRLAVDPADGVRRHGSFLGGQGGGADGGGAVPSRDGRNHCRRPADRPRSRAGMPISPATGSAAHSSTCSSSQVPHRRYGALRHRDSTAVEKARGPRGNGTKPPRWRGGGAHRGRGPAGGAGYRTWRFSAANHEENALCPRQCSDPSSHLGFPTVPHPPGKLLRAVSLCWGRVSPSRNLLAGQPPMTESVGAFSVFRWYACMSLALDEPVKKIEGLGPFVTRRVPAPLRER